MDFNTVLLRRPTDVGLFLFRSVSVSVSFCFVDQRSYIVEHCLTDDPTY